MRRHLLPLLLLLALVSAACADTADPGETGEPDAVAFAGPWQLVEGQGPDGALALVDSHPVTLTIDGDRVGGTAACNGYGATLLTTLPDFGVDALSRTEMACFPQETMALEAAYLNLLAAVDTAELTDDGGMLLTGPGIELRYVMEEPPPTAALVDNEWVLDGLLAETGEVSAITAPRGDPATLVLHADGTLTASTGCRTLSGTWQEAGAEIVTPELTAEGECPPDLAEQDDIVVTVLGDGFRAEVVGDRLTLTDGPDGLSYGLR